MASDAQILRGWLDAVKGRGHTIDDACRSLGWDVGRYLNALAQIITEDAR